MSQNQPPEHLHLLDSFPLGWRGVNLICELEPRGEMAEMDLPYHFVTIAEENFRASYWLDGHYQHVDYAAGDIAIVPSSELLPRVQIDREVPLIELFLDPHLTSNVMLLPHTQIRDPLIQHLGFALKRELASSAVEASNGGSLYAESMAIALSAHLARHYGSSGAIGFVDSIDRPSGLPKHTLQQVLNYIHEHLDQSLTVDHLSQLAQLSVHHFSVQFKRSIGQTPYQYIMQCRIQRAKELLMYSKLSLVEIAHSVGFQNQSHFTRVFRQQTKTTPKRFRDSI